MKKRDSRLGKLEKSFNVNFEDVKAFKKYVDSFTPERRGAMWRGSYPFVDLPGGRKPLLSYDELPSSEELWGFIESMTAEQRQRYRKAMIEEELPIDEFYYWEKKAHMVSRD